MKSPINHRHHVFFVRAVALSKVKKEASTVVEPSNVLAAGPQSQISGVLCRWYSSIFLKYRQPIGRKKSQPLCSACMHRVLKARQQNNTRHRHGTHDSMPSITSEHSSPRYYNDERVGCFQENSAQPLVVSCYCGSAKTINDHNTNTATMVRWRSVYAISTGHFQFSFVLSVVLNEDVFCSILFDFSVFENCKS